jgi:hypothetical protein
MAQNVTLLVPRNVRAAPDPLALYLRPGRNDHRDILNLIAAGDAACFGAVFDPTLHSRHGELREQVLKHRLDAILDPKTQASATEGGYTDAMGQLKWGRGRVHRLADFEGAEGATLVEQIGEYALENGFTQVIAPTHLLRSADEPWFAVDVRATERLRSYLDRNGAGKLPIIYSLAVSYAAFRNRDQRRRIIDYVRCAPFNTLWLKVDGFGATCSPTAARTYIEASSELHDLAIPMVADHVGGAVGLALMAFGAVGGIAHGITLGERFDASTWRRAPTEDSKFGPHRRVYVPAIDAMLKPREADALINMSHRTRGLFACNDSRCCPRGPKDMMENPGRHFLYQRMKEITALGQIPEQLRPQRFLDQHLRGATDKALAAATINWGEEPLSLSMAKKMQENRKRLDALRIALGHHAEKAPPQTFAVLPKTRAAREER